MKQVGLSGAKHGKSEQSPSAQQARAWWVRHCRRALECHPLLQGRAYRRRGASDLKLGGRFVCFEGPWRLDRPKWNRAYHMTCRSLTHDFGRDFSRCHTCLFYRALPPLTCHDQRCILGVDSIPWTSWKDTAAELCVHRLLEHCFLPAGGEGGRGKPVAGSG